MAKIIKFPAPKNPLEGQTVKEIFTDYAPSENCCNDNSYGEVCVKCGKCGRKFMDGKPQKEAIAKNGRKERYIMTGAMCDDNRFELIEKYKNKLIDGTNIETSKDEMAVIDNILFRFWQMGWLDKLEEYERQKAEIEKYEKTVGKLAEKDGKCIGLLNGKETEYIPKKVAKTFKNMAVNRAKDEAIKEFAERYEKAVLPLLTSATLDKKDGIYACLDILKEMVGEE